MVIINGVQGDTAQLIPDDGFQFGLGVFETILIGNRPLFLAEHLVRLENSLRLLGIRNGVEAGQVLSLIEENKLRNIVLKIIVTEKNILFMTRKNQYTEEVYQRGFHLCVSKMLRDENSVSVYIKSISRVDAVLEKQRAAEMGYDESLFLNRKGFLTETGNSNLFFVKNQKIYTPAIECGLLNGIVRAWVIKNFDVSEGDFSLADLYDAQEVFLTNSVFGLMKITQIEEKTFACHRQTEEILNKYKKFISF
ncbi:MAG: hypothetical protein BGN88_04145 [Clostridiales bacterium 43-6]|nr:MAG: hypothetical protein BGN88_04145 [Clostridiales bacterium 43-6]